MPPLLAHVRRNIEVAYSQSRALKRCSRSSRLCRATAAVWAEGHAPVHIHLPRRRAVKARAAAAAAAGQWQAWRRGASGRRLPCRPLEGARLLEQRACSRERLKARDHPGRRLQRRGAGSQGKPHDHPSVNTSEVEAAVRTADALGRGE